MDQLSILEFQKKLIDTVLKASDKIMDSKPNPKQTIEAMRFRFGVFAMMMQMGERDVFTKLSDFVADLKKTSASLPEAERKLADKIAHAAGSLLLINELHTAARTDTANLGKVVKRIEQHVGDRPEGIDFQLIMMVTQAAEMSRDDKLAAETYDHFGKLLSKNKEPRIVEMGKTFEAAARRLSLVGKTIKVSGETVDGKPFDLATDKGKIVLLQFWATWCEPCRMETANIMKNYSIYHDRGFDVVGINVDKDRADLDKFLVKTDLPWKTLYDGEGKHSISSHYGIMSLPTSILVGRDGKVVSIRARGPELEKDLEKLIGPPNEKKEDAKIPEKIE